MKSGRYTIWYTQRGVADQPFRVSILSSRSIIGIEHLNSLCYSVPGSMP